MIYLYRTGSRIFRVGESANDAIATLYLYTTFDRWRAAGLGSEYLQKKFPRRSVRNCVRKKIKNIINTTIIRTQYSEYSGVVKIDLS